LRWWRKASASRTKDKTRIDTWILSGLAPASSRGKRNEQNAAQGEGLIEEGGEKWRLPEEGAGKALLSVTYHSATSTFAFLDLHASAVKNHGRRGERTRTSRFEGHNLIEGRKDAMLPYTPTSVRGQQCRG